MTRDPRYRCVHALLWPTKDISAAQDGSDTMPWPSVWWVGGVRHGSNTTCLIEDYRRQETT